MRHSNPRFKIISAFVFILLVWPVQAQGGILRGDDDILPFPEDGILEDCTDGKRAKVSVWPTRADGSDIPNAVGWPRIDEANVGNGFCVLTPIPTAVRVGNVEPPVFSNVKNVRQRVELLENTGEISDLKIESIFFDSTVSEFVLVNPFGTLASIVGFEQQVLIPDLFADTDGSGTLGAGDILYSLVDFNVYLASVPSITQGGGGEIFNIVNGTTAALPGMFFSTTPFTFDPATGYSGTDFTGTASAEATHGTTAVPEPSAALLLSMGLVLLGMKRSPSGGLFVTRRRR